MKEAVQFKDVKFKAGKVYLKNGEHPYSGTIVSYDDEGKVVSRSKYEGGSYTGYSEYIDPQGKVIKPSEHYDVDPQATRSGTLQERSQSFLETREKMMDNLPIFAFFIFLLIGTIYTFMRLSGANRA